MSHGELCFKTNIHMSRQQSDHCEIWSRSRCGRQWVCVLRLCKEGSRSAVEDRPCMANATGWATGRGSYRVCWARRLSFLVHFLQLIRSGTTIIQLFLHLRKVLVSLASRMSISIFQMHPHYFKLLIVMYWSYDFGWLYVIDFQIFVGCVVVLPVKLLKLKRTRR